MKNPIPQKSFLFNYYFVGKLDGRSDSVRLPSPRAGAPGSLLGLQRVRAVRHLRPRRRTHAGHSRGHRGHLPEAGALLGGGRGNSGGGRRRRGQRRRPGYLDGGGIARFDRNIGFLSVTSTRGGRKTPFVRQLHEPHDVGSQLASENASSSYRAERINVIQQQ